MLMMLPGGLPASTCATMRRAAACPTRKAPLRFTRSTVEIGFRESEEICGVDDAGIVDENVDIAEGAAGLRHYMLGRPRVADVGGDEAGIVAERLGGGFAG